LWAGSPRPARILRSTFRRCRVLGLCNQDACTDASTDMTAIGPISRGYEFGPWSSMQKPCIYKAKTLLSIMKVGLLFQSTGLYVGAIDSLRQDTTSSYACR
jgi:hypothetical protein